MATEKVVTENSKDSELVNVDWNIGGNLIFSAPDPIKKL